MPRRKKVLATRYVQRTPAAAASRAAGNVATTQVLGSEVQGIIVTSALVTFTLAFLNSYLVPRKTPRVRLFIGVAILYIALSITAQFSPRIARGFAVLVMVTAILGEGGGVLNWLMGRGTHDHIGSKTTGTPNPPAIGTPKRLALPPPGATTVIPTLPNLNVVRRTNG